MKTQEQINGQEPIINRPPLQIKTGGVLALFRKPSPKEPLSHHTSHTLSAPSTPDSGDSESSGGSRNSRSSGSLRSLTDPINSSPSKSMFFEQNTPRGLKDQESHTIITTLISPKKSSKKTVPSLALPITPSDPESLCPLRRMEKLHNYVLTVAGPDKQQAIAIFSKFTHDQARTDEERLEAFVEIFKIQMKLYPERKEEIITRLHALSSLEGML